MDVINKQNVIIIRSKNGYILRNTITDEYTDTVYLTSKANINDYEEVPDPDYMDKIYDMLEMLMKNEKLLNKIAKIVADEITDDRQAYDIQDIYDDWKIGISYKKNQYVIYHTVLYKVLSDHISQRDWNPDKSPSLFAKVLIDPTGETIPDWVQPDSTNAYMTGDKVKYEGVVYVSLIDNKFFGGIICVICFGK